MHTLLYSLPSTLQLTNANHTSIRDSWTFTGKSGPVSCGSLLLSPVSWCTEGSVCALQESVSPVQYKFWWLYGGVNGDLLPEGLCHTQLYCTQSPCPPVTADPYFCRRHPNTVLSQSLWGLWVLVHKGLFEPSEHPWCVWGLILNAILLFLLSCWGFSTLGHGVSPHSHSSA